MGGPRGALCPRARSGSTSKRCFVPCASSEKLAALGRSDATPLASRNDQRLSAGAALGRCSVRFRYRAHPP
jgi:hypothetical protein